MYVRFLHPWELAWNSVNRPLLTFRLYSSCPSFLSSFRLSWFYLYLSSEFVGNSIPVIRKTYQQQNKILITPANVWHAKNSAYFLLRFLSFLEDLDDEDDLEPELERERDLEDDDDLDLKLLPRPRPLPFPAFPPRPRRPPPTPNGVGATSRTIGLPLTLPLMGVECGANESILTCPSLILQD